MSLYWQLAAVPFLILLNAFFVAAEYAFVAIRPQQVEAMRRSGHRQRTARALASLKQDPAGTIGAIQVCITMTNLLLGWIGEPAMSALLMILLGPLADVIPSTLFTAGSFAASFVIVTLLTVVFSELLPKALTLRYVLIAAMLTAPPVVVVRRLIRPLVWVMNKMANAVTRPLGLGKVEDLEHEGVSLPELRLIAAQAAETGVLSGRAKDLVLNSLTLTERTARDIMVPRTKIDFLDLNQSMEENRRTMNQRLYSHYPLVEETMDRIVGVVSTKEFLTAYNDASDVMVLRLLAQRPVFVPAGIPLDRLLGIFHEQETQMVLLVDEYGGIEGLVTLQDVADEIVGCHPETLLRRHGVRAGEDQSQPLTVPGDLALRTLGRMLGRDEWGADQPVSTISGLIAHELGRIPREGESVTIDGLQFHVLRSSRSAAKLVQVSSTST